MGARKLHFPKIHNFWWSSWHFSLFPEKDGKCAEMLTFAALGGKHTKTKWFHRLLRPPSAPKPGKSQDFRIYMGKPWKSQNSSKIMKFHQIGAGLPRKPADRICQKNWMGSQNSPSRQLKIVVAPSSDGVERKTGYVGLRTRWVRSRELVFKKNWEV